MPALFHDDVIDAALNVVKTNITALHICSGTPADRAAVLTNSLATVAVDTTDATIANGDTDGRKVTIGAQLGVPVTASGTPAHYCLIDGTRLLARTVVNAASPDLTASSTTDIPAVDFEIGDPVAEA